MKIKTKIIAFAMLLMALPFTASAVSVGWDRYVSGSGGGIKGLYNSGTDHVLIGASATTTSAQLEVHGNIYVDSTTATSTIGNFGGVLDIPAFAGAERGAQNNAAYLALPSTGGKMTVPNGQQDYTVPIVFGTNNKVVLLSGAGLSGQGAYYPTTNGGTLLRYTPTTGTALTVDTNYSSGGSKIENLSIMGTNGTTARTTIGMTVGGTNGGFNNTIDWVGISGFGKGIVYDDFTSFSNITNSVINGNGRNIDQSDQGGANCENMRITNSVIADANNQAGGVTDLKGFYMQESGNCQWNIGFTSFDDNQMYFDTFGGTANIITQLGVHHENPNGHTYSMIESIPTAVNLVNSLIGGDMMNDVVGGQPDQIKVAGAVNLLGFTSDSNNNVTTGVTRIVNALASTTVTNWAGLVCLGANATSFVYANVPCSPFGIGSDRGQPSLYVASSTSRGIGIVGIATSTTNMSMTSPAILNIGPNPATTNSTSTVNMKRLQFQGESASGVVSCAYVVGTAWVIQAGACNN